MATVTNYYNDLKQHKFIHLRFWRSEVQTLMGPKSRWQQNCIPFRGSRGNLFWLLEASYIPGLKTLSSTSKPTA